MAHTSTEQPEALRLATLLDNGEWINYEARAEAAAELRRLHARVQELEAERARLIETYVPKSTETYAQASQAQRVPLALYQRDTIKANAWRETVTGGYWDVNDIIDATEAAHGITQEKQG